MSRPRLLVLTTTFPRWDDDGTPPFVFELCARLTDSFEVTVLAPNAPGARAGAWAGMTVLRHRYAPRRWENLTGDGGILGKLRESPIRALLVPLLLLSQALVLWRRRRQFDLIHAHWLFPQGLIAVLAGGGRPVVCTSHGADLLALRGPLWRSIQAYVARRSRQLTAVGVPLQRILEAIPGAAPVQLAPMGIDIANRFRPAPVSVRRPGQLLFVGRLVPKKGVDLLLRAFAQLASDQAVLRLIGDGPERDRLQSLAILLGVAERVDFAGACGNAELPTEYRRAGLVVLPFLTASDGDAEGLGLTLLEALACGCRVVSTEVAAQSAAIGSLPGWWQVAEPEPALLARGIDAALEWDGPPAEELRQQRQSALARFDWTHVVSGYAELLRRALAS